MNRGQRIVAPEEDANRTGRRRGGPSLSNGNCYSASSPNVGGVKSSESASSSHQPFGRPSGAAPPEVYRPAAHSSAERAVQSDVCRAAPTSSLPCRFALRESPEPTQSGWAASPPDRMREL